MRKLISILLLILMSISILAEGDAEIKKEVSGQNKSTTTEGRIILKDKAKDPTIKEVKTNIINNNEQIETKTIEYKQTEPTDELVNEVSAKQAKPKYWVWGLGILAAVLVGVAASK